MQECRQEWWTNHLKSGGGQGEKGICRRCCMSNIKRVDHTKLFLAEKKSVLLRAVFLRLHSFLAACSFGCFVQYSIEGIQRKTMFGRGSPVIKRFWHWTTKSRPSWRENPTEAVVICSVFAVTGTSTLFVIRPCLKTVGIEGSLVEGPNSYRVLSIALISPAYACLLMVLGTLAGRHTFFAGMSRKLLGRFLPSSALNRVSCIPGQQFVAKK